LPASSVPSDRIQNDWVIWYGRGTAGAYHSLRSYHHRGTSCLILCNLFLSRALARAEIKFARAFKLRQTLHSFGNVTSGDSFQHFPVLAFKPEKG